jgi:hypothetical protein
MKKEPPEGGSKEFSLTGRRQEWTGATQSR